MKNVKTGHDHPIVCLDAGHYGKYNQSPAVKDYYESEMNWKLHLLLKDELEKYGIEVRLTRTDQKADLGLKARGYKAEGSDLLLSVHSNSVGSAVNESVDYPVVYVPLNGSGTELGTKLADCIASVMGTKQKGEAKTRKGSGDWDYYSVIWAAVAIGVPGLILEHSFHTNTRSTKWLMDENNLQKLAQAEAQIVADWFDVSKAEKTVPAVTLTLPVIYPGDKHEHVEVMQALLIGYGYSCGPEGVDGSNGPATQKALKKYQQDSELEADGKCGPATWDSLTRQK